MAAQQAAAAWQIMRLRILAAALLLAFSAPALAMPKCDDALARLESGGKRAFAVERYGTGRYLENTGRGRLAYVIHAWQGNEGGAERILTFTEIPGASGPNWGSVSTPKELQARIAWRRLGGAKLDDRLVVYSGPLAGEWTLACQGKPPIKVSFPRFADYPADKPYSGRVAKMKVPRGLHEEVRLRLTDSLSDDDKPAIAGRYIRLNGRAAPPASAAR
jgi:hypothetical protein